MKNKYLTDIFLFILILKLNQFPRQNPRQELVVAWNYKALCRYLNQDGLELVGHHDEFMIHSLEFPFHPLCHYCLPW